MKSQLDNLDRTILALIQEDNTLGLEYLASKCDLSVTSVQRRLKRRVIVKSGVWIKQQRSLIDPLLVNRL